MRSECYVYIGCIRAMETDTDKSEIVPVSR